MFGLSKKERVQSSIRLATHQVLDGMFSTIQEVEKFGVSEEANVWISTESTVHQMYTLFDLYVTLFVRKERWADGDTFKAAVELAFVEAANKSGRQKNSPSYIFNRFVELSNFNKDELNEGRHFLDSANKAADIDKKVDTFKVAELLSKKTIEYRQKFIELFKDFL